MEGSDGEEGFGDCRCREDSPLDTGVTVGRAPKLGGPVPSEIPLFVRKLGLGPEGRPILVDKLPFNEEMDCPSD